MAASWTAERKAGAPTTSGAGVFTFSPATNCTTGSTMILVVSGGVVSSVTDNQGVNAWNIDKTQQTSNTDRNSICSSYQASGLVTTDTVTVTVDVLTTAVAYWFEEFGGNYSAVDKTAQGTGSNTTTLGTGTTAATSDADEFAVATYNARATGAITKNASYTNFTTGQQAHGSPQGLASYRLLVATGTQNADGTDVNMVTSANGIATYKIVAAAAFVAPAEKVILQAVNRAAAF